MNILVLSPDIPYPANKGQRADVWRKLEALRMQDDVQVALVYFYDAANHQQHTDFKHLCQLKGIQSHGLSIKRSPFIDVMRMLKSFYLRVPYHALVRTPGRHALNDVCRFVERINPDLTLVESLWMYETLQVLIAHKVLPQDFYYRSHNIEYKYMYSQLSISQTRLASIKRFLHTSLIEKYELHVLRAAKRVFDISCDDAAFWRSKGIGHIEVLTAIPESALLDADTLERLRNAPKIYDLLFLGNLRTPNNVQGVLFLINQVLPLVIDQCPNVRLVIAGSSPIQSLVELCERHPHVQLMSNVPDAFALMCQATLLLNPVATGSGVMVKMLDLLMTNQTVITTRQGTHGLPEDIRHTVVVADSAESFAGAIVNSLAHGGAVDLACRTRARQHFGIDKVKQLSRIIAEDIKSRCN